MCMLSLTRCVNTSERFGAILACAQLKSTVTLDAAPVLRSLSHIVDSLRMAHLVRHYKHERGSVYSHPRALHPQPDTRAFSYPMSLSSTPKSTCSLVPSPHSKSCKSHSSALASFHANYGVGSSPIVASQSFPSSTSGRPQPTTLTMEEAVPSQGATGGSTSTSPINSASSYDYGSLSTSNPWR